MWLVVFLPILYLTITLDDVWVYVYDLPKWLYGLLASPCGLYFSSPSAPHSCCHIWTLLLSKTASLPKSKTPVLSGLPLFSHIFYFLFPLHSHWSWISPSLSPFSILTLASVLSHPFAIPVWQMPTVVKRCPPRLHFLSILSISLSGGTNKGESFLC